MQYEVNQHSPPVADVTERRYDRRKLGQVDTCMTILQFRPGVVLSNKSSRPSFFEGWMRGLFGRLLLDSDEECWTSLPAVLAGTRIQPFLEANDRVVA